MDISYISYPFSLIVEALKSLFKTFFLLSTLLFDDPGLHFLTIIYFIPSLFIKRWVFFKLIVIPSSAKDLFIFTAP